MVGSMAEVTYSEVGATAHKPLPDGYHHVRASRSLGVVDFDEVAEAVMTWQMQERSGVNRVSGPSRATRGADVTFRFFGQKVPCRVVDVVDEPDRRGFAYGTLPGHPETGEERFVVDRDPATGEVTVTVTAFSNPALWRTKLAGPVGRLLQRAMTQRYLKALVP
jgi:uncharacterized protein (UPF0548 family)